VKFTDGTAVDAAAVKASLLRLKGGSNTAATELVDVKSVDQRSVVFKHGLRNAAPPALTVLALQFIGLIGGAVIVEKVFGLPGIGSLANSAAVQGDAPVLLGTVVVTVAVVVTVNLLLDIAYGWLNPKVRVS
jgi:peptide/nickel transport system permease protein